MGEGINVRIGSTKATVTLDHMKMYTNMEQWKWCFKI